MSFLVGNSFTVKYRFIHTFWRIHLQIIIFWHFFGDFTKAKWPLRKKINLEGLLILLNVPDWPKHVKYIRVPSASLISKIKKWVLPTSSLIWGTRLTGIPRAPIHFPDFFIVITIIWAPSYVSFRLSFRTSTREKFAQTRFFGRLGSSFHPTCLWSRWQELGRMSNA